MKIDLTSLSLYDIKAMLKDRGYDSDDIFSASFDSCKNNQVKYKIKFNNDGLTEYGFVFIFIDENGVVVADY